VLIKSADDKQGDIDALNALLGRADIDAPTRRRIDQELRTIRAGIAGERAAAYEIDFQYRAWPKLAVIHDLRLEVNGRVAQIDHLLIDRLLDAWVCESKHFADGCGVNEHGEWVSFWNSKPRGIPSPVEQNRKHIAVLSDAFRLGLVKTPKRLGVTLGPQLHSLILVSSGARVSRPKTRAAAAMVDGLDTVIKVDQLATTISKQVDEKSTVNVFGSLARLVSAETLEDIARQLAALHRPIQVDWAARFWLSPRPVLNAVVLAEPPAQPAQPTPIAPIVASAGPQAEAATETVCASCGSVVSPKVAAYCETNSNRFGGRMLCYGCQRKPRAKATT
jgi:hypothetical protein